MYKKYEEIKKQNKVFRECKDKQNKKIKIMEKHLG